MEVPQSIEAVGSTIEDAIARGLEALNVERQAVDILVLESGGEGNATREARVRLTLKAQAGVEPAASTIDRDEMDIARRALTDLLHQMHIQADVEARQAAPADAQDRASGPTLVLDVQGENLGSLIGRRGETLDSLQYLTRLLIAKQVGHYIDLVVDVEGYKSHREQTLQQLAQRMAERVMTTHKPASLEPMPPNERRIVHLALRDHPGVRTESVGTGDNRKVTILPKSFKRQ